MATQTYEQLIAGANKIKENELPESNTHDIVGEQLLQMTNKMQEENSNNGNKFSELEIKTKEYTDRSIKNLNDGIANGFSKKTSPFNEEFNWEIGSISSTTGQDNSFQNSLRTPSGLYYDAELVNNADVSFLANPNENKTLKLWTYFFDENGDIVTSDVYYNSDGITGQGIRQEIQSTFTYKKIRLNTEKVKKVRFLINDGRSENFTDLELAKLYIYNKTTEVKAANSKSSDTTKHVPYDALDDKTKGLLNPADVSIKVRITEINLFAKGKYLKGNIGGKIEQEANGFRSIYKIGIEENTSYYVDLCWGVNANTPGQRYWIVTDEDDTILSVSDDIFGTEIYKPMGCYIPAVGKAKNLYIVNQSGDFANLYRCNENSFEIYKGDSISINGKISGASEVNNTSNIIDDTKVLSLKLTGAATIKIDTLKARTIGFWFKMNYGEIDNINSMDVEIKNGDASINKRTLDLFHWRQIGYFFYKMVVNKDFDTVVITPNFKDEKSSVYLLIGENIYIDQFTFPYLGFNFDRAWTSTDICGAYDNFINNNIPFTITGSILDVSEEIQNKLKGASSKGVLDLGLYGNEEYDGTPYKISDAVSDYKEMQGYMEDVLTKKFPYCENPISFGPRGHVITQYVRKCIINNGFKVARYVPTTKSPASEVFNSKFDSELITISEYGDGYEPQGYATRYGGGYIAFSHALSNDPSSESEGFPQDYKVWKPIMDLSVKLRRTGGLKILNLKQIYKMYTS